MSGKGSIKIKKSEITLNTPEVIPTSSSLKHLPGVVGSHCLRRGLHCKALASILTQLNNSGQGLKSFMHPKCANKDNNCVENSVGPYNYMNYIVHERCSMYDK